MFMIYNNIVYREVCIEVTRRCNMSCPHCLRGDAQNIDLDVNFADNFIRNFRDKNILNLHFTGGEPTLCPEVIDFCLSKFLKYSVNLVRVGMVTNGRNISEKLVGIIKKWLDLGLSFCFSVSFDDYHEPLSDQDISRLNELKELGCVVGTKALNAESKDLLNLGKARINGIGVDTVKRTFQVCGYYNYLFVESTIVLTCKGDVLFCCDYEYDNIDDLRLCSYNDRLSEIIFKTGVNTRIQNTINSGYTYRMLEKLKADGKLKLS